MSEEKKVIKLTLVVEYEEVEPTDVMEAVTDLVEHARGYGRPVSAKLEGFPQELIVRV